MGAATSERAGRAGRRVRALVRGGLDAAYRRVFPEADGAADQWQRVVLNQRIEAHLRSLDPPARTAVEISGNAHAGLGWGSFTSLDYPAFDLCAPVEHDRYDVVICEQVLEHVVDPWKAVQTLRDLCRPGGHVVVSTPFLIKVHELPLFGMHDYWRFTPRGLRTLLESAGLTVDTVDTWGNRACVLGNLDGWSARRRWLPLGNQPHVAVHVWAFARAPGAG